MTAVERILKQISHRLRGAPATEADIHLLVSRLHPCLVPNWLVKILSENSLAGVCFALDASNDVSGFGAELLWFTPAQIVSEATECEPGLSVAHLGFIPVGGCAEGSGDPYFLDLRKMEQDPPLVRVSHDFAVTKPYPLGRIELVTGALSTFFSKMSF